jgi:hypothetical protein
LKVWPHNFIKPGTRRHSSRRLARLAALCAACVAGFMFATRVATAAGGAPALGDGDVRRAEKVLARLRLLYGAADAGDADAYRKLTSKFYPGLFITVAEIPQGDLNTDLSTAVFLAEKLGRSWAAAGDTAADCRNERPDIYLPLCLDLRGGTVRQLLLAKSRLHARWAEAAASNSRGAAAAETARALAEMEAARANDLVIAARVVEALTTIEERSPLSREGAARGGRFDASAAGFDGRDGEFAHALRVSEALLAWLPRSPTFYHLSGARHSYADGLSWYQKVSQSKSPVVSAARGFAPDPLKELRLDAEQVSAAVHANWKSAIRHTRLAGQSLSGQAR